MKGHIMKGRMKRVVRPVAHLSAPLHNERGVALVVALMVMVLMTLLGTAAIYTSTINVQISANEKMGLQAYYAAVAGISDAEARLIGDTDDTRNVAQYIADNSAAKTNVNDPSAHSAAFVNWSVVVGNQSMPLAASAGFDASYSVTISHVRAPTGDRVKYMPGSDYENFPKYRITATGTAGSSSRSIEKIMYMNMENIWTKAVTACGDLRINSNSSTDSYDSAAGAYNEGGNVGTSGDIYTSGDVLLDTNSDFSGSITTSGDVKLMNNSTIAGYVTAGGTITNDGLIGASLGAGATAATAKTLITNTGIINGDANSGGTLTNDTGTINGISTANDADVDDVSGPPACDVIKIPPSTIAAVNDNATGIRCTGGADDPGCSESNCITGAGPCLIGGVGNTETLITLEGSADKDNPKVYYFNGLEMNSNTDLIVTGFVNIYVNGDLLMKSRNIICSNGLDGGATDNATGCGGWSDGQNSRPSDVLLHVYGSSTANPGQNSTVTLDQNSELYGQLYAPEASMTNINANSQVYGSVLAGGLCQDCGAGGGIDANAGVSWDESLATENEDLQALDALFVERRECLYGIYSAATGAYAVGACKPE